MVDWFSCQHDPTEAGNVHVLIGYGGTNFMSPRSTRPPTYLPDGSRDVRAATRRAADDEGWRSTMGDRLRRFRSAVGAVRAIDAITAIRNGT
jgi:hypothetical protein